MENPSKESIESPKTNKPQGFKTMEIQTKPANQTNFLQGYQPPYINPLYHSIVMMIMNFMQTESNKKFYKNEVLNMSMVKLSSYEEKKKIKAYFPSCANFNDPTFDFSRLRDAQFFILRSTCDDDIHKAIKYGIWTSTNYTNHILNNRFKECVRLKIPLFLIFTYFKKSCKFRTVLWNCRNGF